MNRNPEEIRLEKVREEMNRLNLEGYKLARDSKPRKMDPEERREVVQALIEKTYPDKPAAWKESRLRQILGPKTAPAKKPAAAPIRKKSALTPAEVRELMNAYNVAAAAAYGVETPEKIRYK